MTDKRKRQRSSMQKLAILLLVAAALSVYLLSAGVINRDSRPALEPVSSVTDTPERYEKVSFEFGRGYIGDDWQVYFNQPRADAEPSSYSDGIDAALAGALAGVQQTLDIAAFELNNDLIFSAIVDAHQRGVAVRIVTDNEHGLHDNKHAHLRELQAAGIPIVDDGRSALMHNKFMILDARAVWTGSWNYTRNGTYRNNNNALVIEDAAIVAGYQAEFEEMYSRREFGARSRDDGIVRSGGGGEMRVVFAPEADELAALAREITTAEDAIRIMTFVFSLDELAEAILEKMVDSDVIVQGVFENRNSTASWSQLPALHCAGAEMRQDGNPYILHHKLLLIDDDTVITGSFNFSNSAATSNDENIVIIRDADIAGVYLEEWQRIWDSAEALAPGEVDCA